MASRPSTQDPALRRLLARRSLPRPHVPGALGALLAATLVLGVAWALIVPPWQAPDEQLHYGYVQSFVDGPGLPGRADRPELATEETLAMTASNSDQTAAILETKPTWDPAAYAAWQRQERQLTHAQRADGGGPLPPAGNPPLSYLFFAVPYAAASHGGPFGRLSAMRVAGVLWLLVTVLGTWLLAGELFGRRRDLQVVAAAVPALAPMITFISASVSPDGMLYATWTLTFWLAVRLLRRGFTPAGAAALLAMVGIGCTVKATSYALIPGALVAVAVALWRTRPQVSTAVRAAGVALAALALTAGPWFVAARLLHRQAVSQVTGATSVSVASGTNWREFGSYLWQFYLPKLPFEQTFQATGRMAVYRVFFQGVWGRFGWLEVAFGEPVYWVLGLCTVVVIVAAAIALWRARHALDLGIVAFFVITVGVLMFGLHWEEYHLVTSGAGAFMQGRYLLPLVGLAGVGLAGAVRVLTPRRPAQGIAVAVALLFAVQLLGLGAVIERFYA
jgi:4-amino-4-deoxy-L-arabinose transferase-like glycosyltransferase